MFRGKKNLTLAVEEQLISPLVNHIGLSCVDLASVCLSREQEKVAKKGMKEKEENGKMKKRQDREEGADR